MGKRQTRIFPHQLPEQTAKLAGKEANVTLHDQTTFHGVIVQITDKELRLRDMRLKKHLFPIAAIAEIILDDVTPW
jgi:hypothetical protein